jgi:hypothetical protein
MGKVFAFAKQAKQICVFPFSDRDIRQGRDAV